MSKIYLCITFAFLSISLFSQENLVDSKGKKQGSWKKYFPSTSILDYEGSFKDDIPVGEFKYYFKNGKIKAKMVFKDNGKVSYSTIFYENETNYPLASGKYINKLKDSVWNYWGPTNRISMVETYKNGLLDGKKIIYYASEILNDTIIYIAQELHYKLGLREGEQKEYFNNGVLKSKANYKNDKIQGELVINAPTGFIEMKENYVNGIKEGWSYVYDDQGNEKTKVFFLSGTKLDDKQTKKYLEKLKNKK